MVVIGIEGNPSAITSADGFCVTIDFLEGNGFGKICCGITRGITSDDEFCFTATVGKDVCDATSTSPGVSLMISSSRACIFGFLGPVSLSALPSKCLLAVNFLSSLTLKVGMSEVGILYGADRQFFF